MKQNEHLEQVKLFAWTKAQSAKYSPLTMLFAIPNGGQRNIITATKLKAEGVKAGVPDCFLAYPSKGYHGLFIEMKSAKGKVSESQREWMAGLFANGYLCSVCYSFDEAKKVISEYLELSNN